MSETVDIQPQVIVRKDNSKRNAVIGTGLGAIGGGTIGYIAKNVMKNGLPTDEFVMAVEDKIIDSVVKDGGNFKKENKKVCKAVLSLSEDPTGKQIIKFIKKHAKALNFSSEDLNQISNFTDEKLRSIYLRKLKPLKDKMQEALSKTYELLRDSYNLDKKKFVFDECETEIADIVRSAKRGLKGKSSAIWAAASAIILGFGTYVCSKLSVHKDNLS